MPTHYQGYREECENLNQINHQYKIPFMFIAAFFILAKGHLPERQNPDGSYGS
jgi:hypothetical protein